MHIFEPLYYKENTDHKVIVREFGVVQPSLNHCTAEENMTIRTFYISAGWFNLTEPLRITVLQKDH